jgi:hypothetical protein
MTAQERKEKTETYLTNLNVPINPHLPLIEEESEAVIRSGQDIARRILILTYLNVVQEGGDKKEIIAFLKNEGLWNDVSEDEKELLKKTKLTKQDKINLSWRSEGVWLMLWAINKVGELEMPTTQCTINEILCRLPGFLTSTKEFIETATVRPTAEILDMADLLYRMHWSTRQAGLDANEAPADLDDSIVYERHYAINWITYYEENWDDVTTDT